MVRRRLLQTQWPVCALVALYAASVLLFCTSMLSTSTVMHTVATTACANTVAAPVDQVVLVLIDALRPDFVLGALRPFARHGGQCDIHGDTSLQKIREDNRYTGPTFHYMEDSLRSPTDASVAYFLVADAPTTTAQRIKAIATGTMPAFLEAGSNFNSEAISVDSIVRQLNGSAVLLGDDTWEKLFPNTPAQQHWKEAVGIPSFDVADFHTNDDAVLKNVYDVLKAETPEAVREDTATETHAGLIVAHFLGIDHVGHRIDAANPYMQGKILQLDEMLRNVSQTLRERPTTMNTMLLVLGDHGMTNSGDHGGSSAQETDTFLFAQYFPGSLASAASPFAPAAAPLEMPTWPSRNLERSKALLRQRWAERVDGEFDRLRSCHAAAGVPADRLGATYQVDVTSTIAVLLGKPIPYSSCGRVIPEVLTLANATVNLEAVEQCNLAQLQRYFTESDMAVPPDPSWHRPNVSTAQRIADMSYYARRTRTDMNRLGMFLGSTGLLVSAMSIFWSPTIRTYLLSRRTNYCMRWTAMALLLRLCVVFSNSFVVNEDSELLGLLSSLLLSVLTSRVWCTLTQHQTEGRNTKQKIHATGTAEALHMSVNAAENRKKASQTITGTSSVRSIIATLDGEAVFLAVLLFGVRIGVPVLLRYRAHITHTVETESAADRFFIAHAFLHVERLGLVVASCLWVCLYPRSVSPAVVAVTCVALMASYQVPVLHHLLPVGCSTLYSLVPPPWRSLQRQMRSPSALSRSRGGHHGAYAYLVLVLWLTSLCNGRVATAVVIALYGVSLPYLCAVLTNTSLLTQAAILHLAAFVAFFAEGHQCMLNTIDWNASFVGMPGYNLYVGGVLVLSRTFHAFLLVPLALRVMPCLDCCGFRRRPISTEDAQAVAALITLKKKDVGAPEDETHRSSVASRSTSAPSSSVVILTFLYLLIAQSALSCFNGYIQKTHLMLFPIFCPKLLFDAVIALLTSAVVVVTLFAP